MVPPVFLLVLLAGLMSCSAQISLNMDPKTTENGNVIASAMYAAGPYVAGAAYVAGMVVGNLFFTGQGTEESRRQEKVQQCSVWAQAGQCASSPASMLSQCADACTQVDNERRRQEEEQHHRQQAKVEEERRLKVEEQRRQQANVEEGRRLKVEEGRRLKVEEGRRLKVEERRLKVEEHRRQQMEDYRQWVAALERAAAANQYDNCSPGRHAPLAAS